MEQHSSGLGLWLSVYCALSIISGFGLFMFALVGLKNLADAPDGLGSIVFLFFLTALLNFFIVYRLMGSKNPKTIYLARAFEGLKIILTLFAVFSSGPATVLYLLLCVAWLLYFFKSPRIEELYFRC